MLDTTAKVHLPCWHELILCKDHFSTLCVMHTVPQNKETQANNMLLNFLAPSDLGKEGVGQKTMYEFLGEKKKKTYSSHD